MGTTTEKKLLRKEFLVAQASALTPTLSSQEETSLYRRIYDLANAAGLFKSQDRKFYIETFISITVLFSSFAAITMLSNSLLHTIICGGVAGVASTRVALLVHDIVHKQAPQRKVLGKSIRKKMAFLMGNMLVGMSHTWWDDKHGGHHDHPNDPELDPDTQSNYLTFFPSQLADKNRIQRAMARIQPVTFCFLIPFQAISFRVASLSYLKGSPPRSHVKAELAGMAFHFLVYGLILYLIGSWAHALLFMIVHQAIFGSYNSVIFATNHKGMPILTKEQESDSLIRQIVTARNVKAGWFFEFLSGGLGSQIEHHVFRQMSRYNLPKFRPILKEFCRVNGIPYVEESVFRSYLSSLGSLRLRES